MTPSLALIIFTFGTLAMFYLDRDPTVRTSKALWVPTVWFWIVGSRPVTAWLSSSTANVDASQLLEGSPFDRAVSLAFLTVGLAILFSRGKRIGPVLKSSWPIVLYFGFCFISVVWSDFPEVSLKRWIKAVGDLAMMLVVVTDAEPLMALKRFLLRTSAVLCSYSVMLIKYFGDLGRAFDPYGMATNTGVTTDKNALGAITFVFSLAAFWRILNILGAKGDPNRRRHLIVQLVLFLFGIYLLRLAHSATSLVCFVLAAAIVFLTSRSAFRLHPGRVHALVVSMLVIGGLVAVIAGRGGVTQALGRESNLTGRTDIWAAVIPMVPNPIVGAGFESFWLGWRLQALWDQFPVFKPNEAHNGYIEVYLNLGIIGLVLIALILLTGYKRAVSVFRSNPEVSPLLMALILASTIYSFTEAGFRLMSPMWIFLILAVASAARMATMSITELSLPCEVPNNSNLERGRFEALRRPR